MADDFDPVAFILDNNPSDDGSTDEFDFQTKQQVCLMMMRFRLREVLSR